MLSPLTIKTYKHEFIIFIMAGKSKIPVLDSLGFLEDCVAECIVATYNRDGTPNSAPMGLKRISGSVDLKLRAHLGTDTCENLLRNRECTVNIIFDPLLFLLSATRGHGKQGREVEIKNAKKAKHANAPYLAEANAYIEAGVKELKKSERADKHGTSRAVEFTLAPNRIKILKPFPVALNRGLFAAVEIAISLSRKRKAGIKKNLAIIRKTRSRSEYEKISEYVKECVKSIKQ